MGFSDGKKDVANNLALFEVLQNLPKEMNTTSSLESVNSKSKNLLPFLVDLLSITCKESPSRAKCEANRILILILIEFFPVLMKILGEGLIRAIKAGLACGVDFQIPSYNISTTMDVSNLDFNNLLKVDPTSPAGRLLYGKSSKTDFNYFLYNTIKSGGKSTWKTKNSQDLLDINFDKVTKKIRFAINPNYQNQGKTFNNFLLDFVESLELFSKENFMSRITNELTGVIDKSLNTSLDQSINNEKIDKLIDKINDSDPCKDDYQFDDSYFLFTNDDLLAIEETALQKNKGVVDLNLGCGIVQSTIDIGTLSGIFDNIRNANSSNINKTIEDSVNVLNTSLTSNVAESDKKIASLSLNAKIINQIPKTLTKIIFEPKVVTMYQMASRIVNGPLTDTLGNPTLPSATDPIITTDANINVFDGFNYTRAVSVFFEFVAIESLAALIEIMFNILKVEILKLVEELVLDITKKQNSLRAKQLISVINGFAGSLLSQVPTPNTSKYY